MKRRAMASCALGSLLFGLGCSDSVGGGEGTVTFTTWGEDYSKRRSLPPTSEGYSIHDDKLVISIGNIVVADADGTVAAQHDGFCLVNQVARGAPGSSCRSTASRPGHTPR